MTRSKSLFIVIATLILVTVVPAFAEEAHTYSIDELIVLNGIGGWGDVGKIDTSRDIIAPNNKLGFSLKFDWEDHPGDPTYWCVGSNIALSDAVNLADYDTFVCDLYVESTDDKASLCIYLKESDGDRWKCWDHPLKDAPLGKWIHIEVDRDKMDLWTLGNQIREWQRINNISFEPSRGKATYYLDNLCLKGSDGKELDLISNADDGFYVDKSWHEPIHKLPVGTVYLPGMGRQDLVEAKSGLKFAELFGKYGTSGLGAPAVNTLAGWDVPVIGYTGIGEHYVKYLTKKRAWDYNYADESYNKTPFSVKYFNEFHSVALAHPGVTEVLKNKIDAYVRSGIGACMLIDYTFPWANGPFGYAPSMIEAYRKDLAGTDEGLHIRKNGKDVVRHFSDYFRAYNGFRLEPGDIGIQKWSEYLPWKPGDTGAYARSKHEVFFYLRSYEWLKLPDKIGRYYQSKGGNGMWIVPNSEDTNGSSDYIFTVRSVGCTNLFPEWFGNVGLSVEAAYASIPYYLREEADNAKNRFSVLFETGAGGHSAPYWDWQVAYTGAYALSAISRADDFDNDFLDEATYEVQSNPENTYQFNRFRDGVTKALAFQQARKENTQRQKAHILCVSERPPSRSVNSFFFSINQPHTLGLGLSRTHFLFDLRDSLDLEKVIERYKVLAYCPMSPRVGDFAKIKSWLNSKTERYLITHTYVPTRDAKGFWGDTRDAQLGSVNGGPIFGLGKITQTDVKQCCITSAKGVWAKFFKPGEVIDSASGLTKCEQGDAVVMTDAGPLITQTKVGKGNVIYLHFTSEDPSAHGYLSLCKRVSLAVGMQSSIAPMCDADDDTLVQDFIVPGGHSVTVWDVPSLNLWNFEYKPGIEPLKYSAPGVSRVVRFPVKESTDYIVYDFWTDNQSEISPTDGYIELNLKDHITDLYYFGPDSPDMRATIDNVRKTRQKMRDLKF